MYTLVSAYGIAKAASSKWGDADVAQLPMNAMFASYRKLFLTLENTFLDETVQVDFEIFRSEYGQRTHTLDTVLSGLSNETLETVDEVPTYESHYVRYNDAFRAGYKIDTAAPGSHPSAVVYPDDRTEVSISRKDTNMQRVYDYCLVSINGFFHRTDTDGQTLFALNGGKSLLKSRQNQIGLYSFEDIGKIESVTITPERAYRQDNSSLSHKAFFDLTDLDLTNKTVLAVIGGYLYLPWENHFNEHSPGVYAIDFNNVPILDRYFEALPYLDFSSMALPQKPQSPSQINLQEFFSDAHFMKYLTMSQSFFVIVDTPTMFSARHYLKMQKTPGVYTTYTKPTYPLITSTGKVSEYWATEFEKQHVLTCHDANYYNRIAHSVKQSELVSATDAALPYRTYRNSNGYLLALGADKIRPET